MSRRKEPVVNFAERPEPGPLRRVIDVLEALLGKVESLVDVCFMWTNTGLTMTNAATSPGSAMGTTAVSVDFADAGIDQVRVLCRGNTGGAASVILTIYDETNGVELCRVTVNNAAAANFVGAWTTIKPTGAEQVINPRVIGDGADDPVFYNIHMQGRTTQARA